MTCPPRCPEICAMWCSDCSGRSRASEWRKRRVMHWRCSTSPPSAMRSPPDWARSSASCTRVSWNAGNGSRASGPRVAEDEEYIDAEPVIEGFADTVRHTGEEASADEERHETDAVDTDRWRLMAPNAGEADQGGEAEEPNRARVATNRPRLALAMMLAVAAVVALAIIGDVHIGGDQPAPIGWQLVRPHAPRDDVIPPPGEGRAELPVEVAEIVTTLIGRATVFCQKG